MNLKTQEKMITYNHTGRIAWIDLAKGITILLTIIGHSIGNGPYGSTLRKLIFSFHMPLFFILSCVTYRCSKNVEEFKKKTVKSARHLLSAALITFSILTVIECFKDSSLVLNIGYWKGKLYTLIFASGVDTTFNGFHVSMIGIPWFFFALFCLNFQKFYHSKYLRRSSRLYVILRR